MGELSLTAEQDAHRRRVCRGQEARGATPRDSRGRKPPQGQPCKETRNRVKHVRRQDGPLLVPRGHLEEVLRCRPPPSGPPLLRKAGVTSPPWRTLFTKMTVVTVVHTMQSLETDRRMWSWMDEAKQRKFFKSRLLPPRAEPCSTDSTAQDRALGCAWLGSQHSWGHLHKQAPRGQPGPAHLCFSLQSWSLPSAARAPGRAPITR